MWDPSDSPVMAWWISCCFIVQYMYLKLDRLTEHQSVHFKTLSAKQENYEQVLRGGGGYKKNCGN
jgi:hypothetical protein